MAEVERTIDAPVEQVWAVIADGWSYSDWVVGSAHIREVDRHWPEEGARLFHTSGAWPLLVSDVTTVRTADPPFLLVMVPRLWPFGRGVVTLRLAPVEPERTRVVLAEDFDRGLMRWAMVRANDLVLHRRNVEVLRRLQDLAVRWAAPDRMSRMV